MRVKISQAIWYNKTWKSGLTRSKNQFSHAKHVFYAAMLLKFFIPPHVPTSDPRTMTWVCMQMYRTRTHYNKRLHEKLLLTRNKTQTKHQHFLWLLVHITTSSEDVSHLITTHVNMETGHMQYIYIGKRRSPTLQFKQVHYVCQNDYLQ